MKKPVIGILATSNYLVTDDTFKDTYRYGNNYINKIVLNGGVPLLIPFYDEKIIYETLEMCDGLILPGGERVRPVNFEVIDYFYKNNKPILGICLGMQTLAMYSVNIENDSIKRIIKRIDNDNNHWPIELLRNNNDSLAHNIKIDKNSRLYEIIKQDEVMVNSVHKSTVLEVGSNFAISALSEDGLIEGIEYKGDDKFVMGVQFHPEVLPQFNGIFEKFILECEKRQK